MYTYMYIFISHIFILQIFIYIYIYLYVYTYTHTFIFLFIKIYIYICTHIGHSLSTVEGKVYMFGGRSGGYSCAYSYIDLSNLGDKNSERSLYPFPCCKFDFK
jgi:hypothetical protein